MFTRRVRWKVGEGSIHSQSVSLGLCQRAGKQCGITGSRGWVDFPYCADMWLIPAPLAGVRVDTGPSSDQQLGQRRLAGWQADSRVFCSY